MIQDAPQSERLDVLLVLALAFNGQTGKPAEPTSLKLVNESFAALSREDFEILQARARLFDDSSIEEQKIWQAVRLDKIRRRGRPARLDEQINPAQITRILQRETKAAQELILRYLPFDVSRQVAAELGLKFELPTSSLPGAASPIVQKPVDEKIVGIVRRKFLSHFVAFEDIREPNAADRLSISELARFVRQLGVRETAIACRGITSKEALAVFLGKFSERDAREIAEYITDLERIKPFWVAEADRSVRQTLASDFQMDDFLQNLGLQLLAAGFVKREPAAQKYAAQKMTPADAEKWFAYLQESAADFSTAPPDERFRLEKRQRIFERLLNRFAELSNV